MAAGQWPGGAPLEDTLPAVMHRLPSTVQSPTGSHMTYDACAVPPGPVRPGLLTPRRSEDSFATSAVLRDITPIRRTGHSAAESGHSEMTLPPQALTPRSVRPAPMVAATGPAAMSMNSLAATFQGVPAIRVQQPVIEVLAPVAYRPPQVGFGSLPGSYVAPPQGIPRPGSYVAPPQGLTPPASMVIAPSMAGQIVQLGMGSLSYAAPLQRNPSFVPPLSSLPQSSSMAMQVLPQGPPSLVPAVSTSSLAIVEPPKNVTVGEARDQIRQITTGVPAPTEIEKQKAAYSKRLDGQMRYEQEILKMSELHQSQIIYQAAEAQKRQACLAIEQQARQQELQLQQQTSNQMMGMQQELQNWKILLEKQANELVMEYQRKKSAEELMLAQFDAQQKALEMQAQLTGKLQASRIERPESALRL